MPPRPTHFVSLPLGHLPQIRANAQALFDSWIRMNPPIDGFDTSIITEPQRLHLTLGVLRLERDHTAKSDSLHDSPFSAPESSQSAPLPPPPPPDVFEQASLALKDAAGRARDILAGQSLDITLGRIGTFQNPSKCHVLYAAPLDVRDGYQDQNQLLHRVSEAIRQAFKEMDLLLDTRPLQLHCTLLNTTHRKNFSKVTSKRYQKRRPFDATRLVSHETEVIEEGDADFSEQMCEPTTTEAVYDWGTVSVDQIQLCELGSRDPSGAYVAVYKESLSR